MKTRIKRVSDKYFPQYKTFWAGWQYLTVSVTALGYHEYSTIHLEEAKDVIDKYLTTGDTTNGNSEMIEYPTWASLAYGRGAK